MIEEERKGRNGEERKKGRGGKLGMEKMKEGRKKGWKRKGGKRATEEKDRREETKDRKI